MAASSQPTSGKFFIFFYFIPFFYTFSLPRCLQQLFPPYFFFAFFFLYSSLGLPVSNNSLLSTFSLLFFPFTLLSWTLIVSNNSLFSVFSLVFFFCYPSLLDSDYLHQLFLLIFFSFFFFFLYPSLLDFDYLIANLPYLSLFSFPIFFPFLKLITSLNF